MRGLNDYRGRLVLLNIWATWCEPCQREMPSMERLYREMGPRGLKVVAVSIDDGGAAADIREFVKEHGLTFDILHDPTGGIMQTYQMIGVPESFLISPDGLIQKKAFETNWYAEENRVLVGRLLAAAAEGTR
jgi:peroxiredoxin